MTHLVHRFLSVAAILALMLVSGCSDEPRSRQSVGGVGLGSAQGDDSTSGEMRIVRSFGGSEYEVAVKSVRADGLNLELILGVRLAKEGAKKFDLDKLWAGTLGRTPSQLRLIDFDNREVLSTGEASVGSSSSTQYASHQIGSFGSKETTLTTYFASPVSDTVTLMMPLLGLVSDLRVERVASPFVPREGIPVLSSFGFERSSMQQLAVPFESESIVRVADETVTISIPSDILFEFGSAELSSQAVAAIESAKNGVMEYSTSGVVTVVGHTDDQGSDAINDPLSRDRAQAVANVLSSGLTPEKFSMKVEGLGSKSPAVAGESEEARAANRRVDLQFAYAPPQDVPQLNLAPPPEPVIVGHGNGPLVLDEERTIEASKVERVNGYLVGTFLVTRTAPDDGLVSSPFDTFIKDGRRFTNYWSKGANMDGASLLTSTSRLFPIDYEREGKGNVSWRTLGDGSLRQILPSGATMTATVVWQDPGTDTVTVDVAGSWRITDVPVEAPSGD